MTGHSIPIPLSEVCNFYFYHCKWASSTLEWGENPPKPPSHHQGASSALEWGENPPKPPSHRQGAGFALEWGGKSPPNPPSLRWGARFAPEWGGKSPPNPPSQRRGAGNSDASFGLYIVQKLKKFKFPALFSPEP